MLKVSFCVIEFLSLISNDISVNSFDRSLRRVLKRRPAYLSTFQTEFSEIFGCDDIILESISAEFENVPPLKMLLICSLVDYNFEQD